MMQKWRPQQRGYTLIEILIVMLIISIVGVASLLSISSNKNTRLKNYANELMNLISLAEQQAMLQPAVIGLKVNEHGLQFYVYQEATSAHKSPTWLPLVDNTLGRHSVPRNIQVVLSVVDQDNQAAAIPSLIITPSGSLTPFTLSIADQGHPPRYQITGAADGSFSTTGLADEKK